MKYKVPEEARTQIGNLKYLDGLRELARDHRKEPTEAEKIVWEEILEKRKTGFLFLRQKPLGKFILDFYCSKLVLAIEIDGDSHDNKKYLDKYRDLYFIQRGIKTIRYRNEEVFENIGEVKKKIQNEIDLRVNELK